MSRSFHMNTVQREWVSEGRAAGADARQTFLESIWSGCKLGDAAKRAGISFEAANGIMIDAIEEERHLRLRSPDEVLAADQERSGEPWL